MQLWIKAYGARIDIHQDVNAAAHSTFRAMLPNAV